MTNTQPHITSSGIEELIERLRNEGVISGQEKAEDLVTNAQKHAEWIIEKAELEAKQLIEKARQQANDIKSIWGGCFATGRKRRFVKIA